jgi:hypothetical protein
MKRDDKRENFASAPPKEVDLFIGIGLAFFRAS